MVEKVFRGFDFQGGEGKGLLTSEHGGSVQLRVDNRLLVEAV